MYEASPGEANAVVVRVEGALLRISDAGALITAGPGCFPAGADVLCNFDWPWQVRVLLGDGNDSADLSAIEHEPGWDGVNGIEGGPGNDYLSGTHWTDSVDGGEGDDQLVLRRGSDSGHGGPGNDSISGGGGSDYLGGYLGDDIMIGGPGPDTLVAWGGSFRLTQVLLVGAAGRDTLSGIEFAELEGGPGSDVINAQAWRGHVYMWGLNGNDLLVGGFGHDSIGGGYGNDRLAGRAGRDYLTGFAGEDVLYSRDGWRDGEVNGGVGYDRARVDRFDPTSKIEAFFP